MSTDDDGRYRIAGKGKRKRSQVQAEDPIARAIKNEAEKAKRERDQQKSIENHGDSWWVSIMKSDLTQITAPETQELRAKLMTYEIENGDTKIKNTGVRECPKEKVLNIRVHSSYDIIALAEIVRKVTNDEYQTFCFKDLDEDKTRKSYEAIT